MIKFFYQETRVLRRLMQNLTGSALRWGVGKTEKHPVILRNEVTKDPVVRTAGVTIRDPLRMPGRAGDLARRNPAETCRKSRKTY